MAVVPTAAGTTTAVTRPELYGPLPDLPFPLELLALCMARTLTRKGHEGALDASE